MTQRDSERHEERRDGWEASLAFQEPDELGGAVERRFNPVIAQSPSAQQSPVTAHARGVPLGEPVVQGVDRNVSASTSGSMFSVFYNLIGSLCLLLFLTFKIENLSIPNIFISSITMEFLKMFLGPKKPILDGLLSQMLSFFFFLNPLIFLQGSGAFL